MQSSQNTVEVSPAIEQGLTQVNPWLWAHEAPIQLVGGPFSLDGHEFQIEPMNECSSVEVVRKATQMTFTEGAVLKVLHAMRYGLWATGCLYLFPTQDTVTDFSASRFNPLIRDNPDTIGCFVRDTNRSNLKRIGSGYLYFRSGRLGQEIQGQQKTSAALISIPADHAVHDEYDLMSPQIDEFVEGRLAHSKIKTKTYLSNPSLPDYGISAKFDQSDQRYWFCRCRKCNEWTCMDDPNLTEEGIFEQRIVKVGGNVIRACSRCGSPVDPRDGQWVKQRQDVIGVAGFTIGHPSAAWIEPAKLLHDWQTTKDRGNFIRLKMGRPYIEAEDRLTENQVLACCNRDAMPMRHPGPCASGVDVKASYLNVVIGFRPYQGTLQIAHVARVKSFQDLHDLNKAFNVKSCVINLEPDTHKAREFQAAEEYEVFLCHYNEHQHYSAAYDSKSGLVQINRTEIMDATHKLVTTYGRLIIPRQGPEVLVFAKECCATAKRLEVDELTGSRHYTYIKLSGNDDYRHSLNYFLLAVDRVGIYEPPVDKKKRDAWDEEDEHESKSWMAM